MMNITCAGCGRTVAIDTPLSAAQHPCPHCGRLVIGGGFPGTDAAAGSRSRLVRLLRILRIATLAGGIAVLGYVLWSSYLGPPSSDERIVVSAGPAFHELSLDEALRKATAEEKLVMIDFHARWCQPCRELEEQTWTNTGVQEWLRNHAVAIKSDIDADRELAALHHVRSIPALVFLKSDGSELGRLVGFHAPGSFLAEAEGVRTGNNRTLMIIVGAGLILLFLWQRSKGR